jgi:hypothetical protein
MTQKACRGFNVHYRQTISADKSVACKKIRPAQQEIIGRGLWITEWGANLLLPICVSSGK